MSAFGTWIAEGRPLVSRWAHDREGMLTWVGRTANVYHHWTRWLRPWGFWWLWIVKGNTGWQNVWCRLRGHPNGTVFYNAGGMEPDNHCKDCGELIG